MRQFIRHPSDIPIEIQCAPDGRGVPVSTRNVSYGGLAFVSDTPIGPNTVIGLRMPHLHPPFELPAARVAWCHPEGGGFAVGVEFLDAAEAFQVRMVEQVCQIEIYRRDVEQREGRQLTAEEAAQEWISRKASTFPDP
jgi:hypothetical protein